MQHQTLKCRGLDLKIICRRIGVAFAACLILSGVVATPLFATLPGIGLQVPAVARKGETVTIKVEISGAGSEGVWYSATGMTFLRGYFDHCGWCSTPCLVGGEIQPCTDSCGPYTLSCSWDSGHEFSPTWYGGPTWEFEVTGCSEATITPIYLGPSHEGPVVGKQYVIDIVGGVEADFILPSQASQACVDEAIEFEDNSCGGELFHWDFGDGSSGFGEIVSHGYKAPGDYQVTLTVSDAYSNDQETNTVHVVDNCATLQGVVTFAPDGTPLPGVSVSGKNASTRRADMSSGTGVYKFKVPGNSSYSILAEKNSFVSEFIPGIFLENDETRSIDFSMIPKPPEPIEEESELGDQPNDVEEPVNPAIGNFHTSKVLFQFPGIKNMGVAFRLTYNSKAASENGPLGFGWTHKYHMYLLGDGDDITIVSSDGHREFYKKNNGIYEADRCHPSFKLTDRDPDGWTAETGGGFSYEFDGQGHLVGIKDLNGNIISLSHSTHLDSITDTHDRIIHLFYDGDRLSHVTSPLKNDHTAAFIYDGNGNLTRITDPRGNAWNFTYDDRHQLITETDRRGNLILQNVYDEKNQVIEQLDADNRSTVFNYRDTALGRTVTIVPPGTPGYTHEYDAAFNLLKVTDSRGFAAQFFPGANGQPVSIIDKNGISSSFETNNKGLLTAFTNRLGVSHTLTYNDLGQLTRSTDEFAGSIEASYDGNGNMTVFTDRSGNSLQFTVNDSGQSQKIIDSSTGGVWQIEFNETGQKETLENPENKLTGYQYDGAGRITGIEYPESLGESSREFDANGNLLWVVSPLGSRTLFSYDENDNLLSQIFEPTGASVKYTYDKYDRVLTKKTPGGGIISYAYNPSGSITSVIGADGAMVSYAYNERNEQIEHLSPSGRKTQYSYDPNGNLTGYRGHLDDTWLFEYDRGGRIVSFTDSMGRSTRYERKKDGSRLQAIDPLNHQVELYYDNGGRKKATRYPDGTYVELYRKLSGEIEKIIDEKGNEWKYGYNALHQLVWIEDPKGMRETYEYDAKGRRTKVATRKGDIIAYQYDLDGRLILRELPGDLNTSYTYEYNQIDASITVTITDPSGITTKVYNNEDRLKSLTDIRGNRLTFEYTLAGRIKKITYPGSHDVSYAYDGFGRLQSIIDWLGNITGYQYDVMDRVQRLNLPNGTYKTFDYDVLGNLSTLSHRTSDGSSIANFTITRDALNRISAIAREHEATPDVTDASRSFSYDEVNRIQTRTMDSAVTNFQFDDNGNLIQKTSSAGFTAYTYDAMDRLTGVNDDQNSTSYAYAFDGTRVSKTHNGVETRYLQSEGKIFATLDENNIVTAYHFFGPGLIYSLSTETGIRVYHTDPRGSVIGITDPDQQVVQTYAYGPYGKVVSTSTTLENEFCFVGEQGVVSDENGLYYMQARYYDSESHRFISEDPLGTVPELNVYGYANHDPINFIDPTGLSGEETAGIFDIFITIGGELEDWGYSSSSVWGTVQDLQQGYSLLKSEYNFLQNPNLVTYADVFHDSVFTTIAIADKAATPFPPAKAITASLKYGGGKLDLLANTFLLPADIKLQTHKYTDNEEVAYQHGQKFIREFLKEIGYDFKDYQKIVRNNDNTLMSLNILQDFQIIKADGLESYQDYKKQKTENAMYDTMIKSVEANPMNCLTGN